MELLVDEEKDGPEISDSPLGMGQRIYAPSSEKACDQAGFLT